LPIILILTRCYRPERRL
jgi:hypothetical protein